MVTKSEAHAPLSLDHLDTVTLTRLGQGAERVWTVRLQGAVPLLVDDMPATPLDDLSPMDLPAQSQVEALLVALCLPGAASRAKVAVAS